MISGFYLESDLIGVTLKTILIKLDFKICIYFKCYSAIGSHCGDVQLDRHVYFPKSLLF